MKDFGKDKKDRSKTDGNVRAKERAAETEVQRKSDETIHHLNRVLHSIRNVNQIIVRAKEADELIEAVCDALVADRGFEGAWIILAPAERSQEDALRWCQRGFDDDVFGQMVRWFDQGKRPRCCGRLQNGATVKVTLEPEEECGDCPMVGLYGRTAALGARLVHGGRFMGCLGVSLARRFAADPQEQELLAEIAGDVAFGLHKLKSERERAESERLLAFAIEQMPVPVIIARGPDVQITRYNQAAIDLLAVPADDLRDIALADHRQFWPTFHPDGTPYEVADLPLTEAVEQKKVTRNREIIVRHKDHDHWISASAAPLVDDRGEVLAGIVVFPEITAVKEKEAQLHDLERQFRQAQRLESIGRLAGGVAHDFNNLLTVINSYADFAAEALRRADPVRADIDQIREAGRRASALTRQLLAFSRRQVLEPKILCLNEVIEALEPMLRRLIGEDIDFKTRLAPELGSVNADPAQIEQVLMNLAVNARDAMPKGGMLTIETADVELDAAYSAFHTEIECGRYVMLAVTDNGIGMTEAVREHIFEPFYTTKAKGQGTGLGLATVYGTVKQSGGHIAVYSEPGQGATFKIYLPRTDGAPGVESPEVESPRSRGDETILVVEDEAPVRALAERILAASGYEVLAAANGGEALLQCEKRPDIDLLLTDVVMPKMSGKDLAERLHKLIPNLRVLYMSGYTDNAIVHHGVLDKGTHFISKPFTAAELNRKVRRVLDEKPADSTPTPK
jgi:signal transduction histidine kinase/ActR/RegA family two-component response regulator